MSDMSEWLKSTVLGIIVLSVVSTFVAVYVSRKALTFKEKWYPKVAQTLGRVVLWWMGDPLRQSFGFTLNTRPYEIISFFAYELAKLVLLPWVAFASSYFFLRSIEAKPATGLPLNSILFACVVVFCVYEVVRTLARIWYHKMFTTDEELREIALSAMEKVLEENKNSETEKAES